MAYYSSQGVHFFFVNWNTLSWPVYSFSARRVDNAHRLLTSQETEGTRISVSSLNVIMSACAELGDVDRAFATWDDFNTYNIEPNADTYSFLLEALAVNMSPLEKQDDAHRMQDDAPGRLDAASAILSLMEGNGVKKCQHCIGNYVQLLCNVGRLDAATEFLLDSVEKKELVGNRILCIVAKNNAKAGNFDIARLLASKTTEHFGYLDHRINEIEKERSGDHGADEPGMDEPEERPEHVIGSDD